MYYFLLVYILMKDKSPTIYSYYTFLSALDKSTESSPTVPTLSGWVMTIPPAGILSRRTDVILFVSNLYHMLEIVEMFQSRGGSMAPIKFHKQKPVLLNG